MGAQKVVLVTGASSGIGRATAAYLHERGHRVFGTSRNPDRHAAPFQLLALDVTDDAAVAAAVAAVLAEAGRIDALVNNAGVVLAGAVEDTSPAEALAVLNTNVVGVQRMARSVLPAMRGQGGGVIINVGSTAGSVGMPFQGLYCASKYALEGLTEALRLEVAPFGVSVALVAPGDTATAVVENRIRARASAGPASAYHPACAATLARYEADERAGAPAGSVAARIAAIVEGRSRGPRHAVGPLAQRILIGTRPFIPTALFQWGLARYYGL
ncbi:SDR family oxidoreductase [Phreatobacter sp.]|uniref:SDR family oxidoreductase n=1 Tax=Phreatobacter sp. TaxID=1966341 RepID=UPI003F70009C